jgi:cytochrome P450
MAATAAFELDLPVYDPTGLDRAERLALIGATRDAHWLARTPLGFAVMQYEDAAAVLRDRRFHSALSLIPRMQGVADAEFEERRPSILSMEGDEHTRLRRLVNGAFTPAAADRLRPFMREVVGDLLDAVAEEEKYDFVARVCQPYPIPIICELLGAPRGDWELFSRWATDIFKIFNQSLADDLPAIQAASAELEEYMRALVGRRREEPDQDLLSALIAVEEEGDRLSSDELIMLAEAVLMAGTDTTRNQLGCCVALFGAHRDQWRTFVQRPELAPRAVEECMRYLGAVAGTIRVASEPIEYRDVLFPTGSLVSVSLAAANRDPDMFPEPDVLDIEREPGVQQMTFGFGIHRCLGAHLARAELQEALVLLAERMPDLHLAGPVEWKPETFGIWGPARLPVAWTPAPRSAGVH